MPRPHVEEERRQQILQATWHVISVSGFRSLRLSDVAKRAGVSSGMIHYYFDTKRDLLKPEVIWNIVQPRSLLGPAP